MRALWVVALALAGCAPQVIQSDAGRRWADDCSDWRERPCPGDQECVCWPAYPCDSGRCRDWDAEVIVYGGSIR